MLFWLVLFQFVIFINGQCTDVNGDSYRDTMALIERYGYQGESHEVETEDGYLLTMHRILPRGNDTEGKSPVILQHGLLCSSADWILMGPNAGFGYILADAGYDVWLGNNRGNKYSRKHKTLDPDADAKDFWNFSWNEMGIYDLPAEIDYVLSQTNQNSLFYAGHSQGTTQFFVMGSKKPEYNQKIKLMGAFAPVAFMGHAPSPFLHIIAPLTYLVEELRRPLGLYEFKPSSDLTIQAGQRFCSKHSPSVKVCSNALFLVGGLDTKELNETMLPVILGHCPAGASTKQFLHYSQNVLAKDHFREWNDFKLSSRLFNRRAPPDYPLKNLTAPVALFYSDNDWMSGITDVQNLWNLLPNVVAKIEVKALEGKGFNHLDYLYATNAPQLLYKKYMELMEKYQ